MKVTEREFRIAAAASFFGFLLCYFLFGQASPPRRPTQMTVLVGTSAMPSTNFWVQLDQMNVSPPRMIPSYPVTYGIRTHPTMGQPGRRNVDLFSSRYRVEVDLSDLY